MFTAVDGTDHKVRATHPVWMFEKSVGNVVITDNNGKADDLVVAGFDVRGKVKNIKNCLDAFYKRIA